MSLELKDKAYISEISWYTLDENYKYIIAGISDGHMHMIDISQTSLIMKFERFGSSIY